MPATDYDITWAMLIVCGVFFTLGSIAFVHAFEEPPKRAFFYWFKHAQTDELLGAWMFLFGTVPAVPYMLVFFSVEPSAFYFFGLLAAIVFVFASFLFVVSCYPSDKVSNILSSLASFTIYELTSTDSLKYCVACVHRNIRCSDVGGETSGQRLACRYLVLLLGQCLADLRLHCHPVHCHRTGRSRANFYLAFRVGGSHCIIATNDLIPRLLVLEPSPRSSFWWVQPTSSQAPIPTPPNSTTPPTADRLTSPRPPKCSPTRSAWPLPSAERATPPRSCSTS